jgi:glycosyltransferase involved in cell wall biosynthesis
MKIINLIQKPQLRGAEIFACQLSNHLQETGNEVIVVTIFKGNAALPFKGKVIHLDRPENKRLFDLKGWKEFAGIVGEFKPDVIQANAADTLKFSISSKFFNGWNCPVIFRNANKMGDFISSFPKMLLNKLYISQIDYVISVSKECELDFKKTFNYPNEKIRTIEIGVEDDPILNRPQDLDFVNKDLKIVSHIGGFVPEKNHGRLVNIFREIVDVYPNTHLLLIGKGRLEEEIKQEVFNLKLENNVHFLGYRNDVLGILSLSHAFVLPSLIEGLPGVILEAMYCETPVVAYNVGGIKEVVKPKTGWLVDKNDEKGFRESLIRVLQEERLVDQKIKEAKKMILNKFLNSVISERFHNCYKEIVS